MTLIRSHSRLLLLAGVILMTAAVALMPAGAAFADSRDGSQTPSALFAPTPPTNLSGSFTEGNAGSFVQLSWEDSAQTVNPLCYGAMFPICLASAFGFSDHTPASLDAPTEYVVERRQPRQQGRNGYYINGEHDWTRITTLSGTDGATPATAHRDAQYGRPSRSMEYRVKACNAQGCSDWSNTASVYIRWSWCAANANLCD